MEEDPPWVSPAAHSWVTLRRVLRARVEASRTAMPSRTAIWTSWVDGTTPVSYTVTSGLSYVDTGRSYCAEWVVGLGAYGNGIVAEHVVRMRMRMRMWDFIVVVAWEHWEE